MSLATQFATSPRVSFEDSATELTLQAVVNELRLIEYSWQGMSQPSLLDAEGKANLGGGLFTGITYTGQDGQLAFASQRTPVETGTITTADSTIINRSGFDSLRVIDLAALFQTVLVVPGSFIINWTDMSIASVLQVVSETELIVEVPEQGTDNQYGSADSYSVFNMVKRSVISGNPVAVDEVDAPIEAVLGTFGTFVVVEKSTSAALLDPIGLSAAILQMADVHGQVQRSIWVDTSLVSNGNGYQQTPYNNFTDAADAAEAAGIQQIMVLSDATLDRQLRNFIFIGIGNPTLDINGQDINRSEFRNLQLDGTMVAASGIRVTDCDFRNNFSGFNGKAFTYGLQGTFTCAVGCDVEMIDGHSAVGGLGRPTVNSTGGSSNIAMRGFRGGLNFGGTVAGDACTVSMPEGKLTLLATNTDGDISVRGMIQFTDNSAGSVIDRTGLVDTEEVRLAQELIESDQVFDIGTGLLHYYRKNTLVDLIPAKTVITTQTVDTSLKE